MEMVGAIWCLHDILLLISISHISPHSSSLNFLLRSLSKWHLPLMIPTIFTAINGFSWYPIQIFPNFTGSS